MQGPVRRLSLFVPASLLVTLFAVSCILDLSGPGGGIGYFALAPAFPGAATAIVDVDSVHVELRRTSDSTVALDTAFAVTSGDSIDLSLRVVLKEPGETFWLELDCYDPDGNLVFAAGPLEVTATTSAGDVEPQDIDVEYVGVGADAVDVRIVSTEVSLRFGATVTLEAQALDGSGDPISGTPIKWLSHDTDRLTVNDSKIGQITAGYLRGPAAIEAQLLTGLADTITVDVLAVPNSITVVSGNDQTALIGGILADPVVIQVDAADGPMQDVAVDFATSDDGSFDPTSASTDAAGRASTVWTLGSAEGTQTGTATATDWPGVTGSFRATAVTPQTPRLSFTVQPNDVDPGAIVTPAVEVTALNEFGVVDVDYTGDITIAIANNPGGGTLSGTTTVSPTLGVAQFSDLSIDLAGAGYTLSATASELEPATSTPFNVGSFQAATVSWTNAAGGNWSNPSNWDAGRVPTAIDTVDITLEGDYNVTLDQSAAVQILRVGGTSGLQAFRIDTTTLTVSELLNVGPTGELLLNNEIGGNGSIDIQGRMQWTGGTISTVGPLTIGSTGVLEINASNFVTLNGPDLRNDGTVDWFAGGISLEDGNIENNANGTFNAYAEASISAYGTVHNYGFFEKEGADSTRVSVPFYNYDAGVINIGSGWLLLSGDFNHADQAVLEGVGTLNISSANVQSFQGYVRPGDLGDATGILTIEGSLALSSSANVELTINGTTQGQEYDALVVDGDLSLGGQLNINAGGYTPTLDDVFSVLFFDSRTGDFSSITGLDVGGGITLEPQWNANSLDLVATNAQPAGTVAWLSNFVDTDWHNPANWDLGRVPTATDTAQIIVDVNVTVGMAADVTVARLELGGPANINTQAVTVEQGVTLRIDSSATIETSGQLLAREGMLAGQGTMIVRGDLQSLGATIVGPGNTNIEVGGRFLIGGGPTGIPSGFDGRVVRNDGQVEWSNVNIVLNNGAQIVNNAFMDIDGIDKGLIDQGDGAPCSIANNGRLRRTTNTNSTAIAVPLTSNSGSTLQVLSGFLTLAGASSFNDATIEVGAAGSEAAIIFANQTHSIDAESMVTVGEDGVVQFSNAAVTIDGSYDYTGAANGTTQLVSGSVDFNGSTTVIPLLTITSGTLGGTATITIADGMVWTSGSLAGTGTLLVNPAATLAIDGSSFTIDGFTIDNRGTSAWLSGTLTGLNNSQFLNEATATFEMVSDGTWGGSGSFQNDGTFRYTGTTIGTFGWAFTNAGTLDAVGPNGILRLIGDFTHQDGAIIQGSGTIDLTTTPVLGWDGDVNPGGTGATGILNFLGSGSPSPLFTANVEIGGTTVGTQYDQATVSQTLTVNGRLNVDLINGFQPQLGQTFTILTFGDRIGEFSDTTGLAIPGNLAFDLVWNTTSLDLVVVDASPVSPADVIFFSDSGGGLDYGVFTNSAEGSSLTRVVSTGSPLQFLIAPRWSMDRERIAFSNDASGTSNIYMATSTGAELTVLVNNIASGYPRWSHNGQHLGFICRPAASGVDDVCVIPDVTGPIGDIPLNSYTMAASAMPAEWQTGSQAADWDPRPASQDRFLFARDSGVVAVSRFFSMSYDGTGLDTITTDVLQVGGGPLRALEMDVSTDGSMIVFVGLDTQSYTERLYVVNTDGTGLRQLTFPTGTVYDERPLFSPDGSEVLFGRRDDFCNLTYWIVDINNTDGSLERQITGDVLSCEMDPYDQVGMDWSPSGDRITLVGIDETYNWWRVYVVPSTVTPINYQQVRVPIGRDADAISWLFEGQPNWRP
jgi:hypothetical protein